MKRFLSIFVLLGIVSFGSSAKATDFNVANALAIATASEYQTLGIDWKVGDQMKYQMSLFMGLLKGSMVKVVESDEGAALWIKQDLDILIQKQEVRILLNKADGKILKMIVNGKEQTPPENNLEIISTDEASVTVPAGTFDTIHVVARSKDVEKLEAWINPVDTAMDGTVKQVISAQRQDIVTELVSFKRN
jgi:hypothetical protein